MTSTNESSTTRPETVFTTVDPTVMKFSEKFRCAMSTAGQVVVGLKWLADDITNKKTENDYQSSLYPKIVESANEVVNEYMKVFVNEVTEPLQIQVFAANLNGRLNDGRLRHDIPCKNVTQRSRYERAQLGQLLSLLYDRLLFISRRDVKAITRYEENENERVHFEDLQKRCVQFCGFLRSNDDSVMSRWTAFIDSLRKTNEGSTQREPRGRGGRGRGRWNQDRDQWSRQGGRGSSTGRGGRGSDRGGRGSNRGRGQTQE